YFCPIYAPKNTPTDKQSFHGVTRKNNNGLKLFNTLSKVHQPTAERYCIQRFCGISRNDYLMTGTSDHSISGTIMYQRSLTTPYI
ncbi:hypothetical protein, partial [Escherichia coli]